MAQRVNAPLSSTISADIERTARGLLKAVEDAWRETLVLAEEWKSTYFPRDQGNLINFTRIRMVSTESPFVVEMDCELDYASYVNAMRTADVNWTRAETEEQFWFKLSEFISDEFEEALTRHLQGLDTGAIHMQIVHGLNAGVGAQPGFWRSLLDWLLSLIGVE